MKRKSTKIVIFQVDWLKKFKVAVEVENLNDARPDANNVLRSKFDLCARITDSGTVIKQLPADAEPVKNCDWAWIIY